MRIGLDFDGVIADCGRLKSETALRLYGVQIPPADFKKELVISRGLLTLEQYRAMQKLIYETVEAGMKAMPVPEALTYLKPLTKQHHVQIITSRTENGTEVARQWLALQDPGLEIEFTSVGPQNSKAEAVNGYDIYVDDDLDKIEPLVEVVPHRFLLSWGYNQHVQEGSIAQRVGSWTDLYKRIAEIDGS
jgi:uncharacterized HAD superfamily protein